MDEWEGLPGKCTGGQHKGDPRPPCKCSHQRTYSEELVLSYLHNCFERAEEPEGISRGVGHVDGKVSARARGTCC